MNNDDLVNMNSLDIWTFADQYRATVKSATNSNNDRPILTGMAIGLNSTLTISDGHTKLPSCPILLLSNSDGLLQVYYFIHKSSSSLCRTPEVIKQNQTLQSSTNINLGMILPSVSLSQTLPFGSVLSTTAAPSSTNTFSFSNVGSTSLTITPISSQPKEEITHNILNSNQSSSQITNASSIYDISKTINTNNLNKLPSIQSITPTKITTNNDQSSTKNFDNKKLLQMVDEIQSKLKTLQRPFSKLPEPSNNLDKSLETLITTLNDMTISLQTSIQSIKTMTNEHIESLTRIENARHQIRLSQKENLHDLLKDRELDPWTQLRLDSIKNKYDQIKHKLNVLLQLTHKTIHNKSLSINNETNDDDDDDIENEDFLPDLEILNTSQTMKQGIQKHLRELSHQVSETEKDLQNICAKFNKDFLNSKQYDSNLTKTTIISSNRLFHKLDSEILLHLQANHQNVNEIHVPQTPLIHFSSINESKKSSTIEISKTITPITPIQTNSSPTIESESFKNMLRIVRASIDLYSGIASPEQLRELSNKISTSPLSSSSSIQKSHTISINKTPTIPKTTTTTVQSKSPIVTKPLNTTITSTNILQTPTKTVTSSIPNIAVTPPTPLDIQSKIQSNKTLIQTPTDLSKTSGDSVIRSLLNNAVTSSTTITSNTNQPIVSSTANQINKSNIPSTTIPQVTTNQTPTVAAATTTTTTSVQPISPSTPPITSTGVSSFGSRPIFSGNTLNLTPTTSSTIPFGNVTTTPTNNIASLFGNTSITTTSAPSSSGITTTTTTSTPFGAGFSTPTTTTAPTAAASTGFFGTVTTSASTPFGTGFGTATTSAPTTAAASSTGAFGTATTSASSPFGTGFGTPTTTTATTSASGTSPFGAATTTPSTHSPFGSGFGAPPPTTTTMTAPTLTSGTSLFSAAPTTSTSGTSLFGGSPTSTAGTFGSSPTITSPFGSGFGATLAASTSTTFSGFGGTSATPTSTSNAPVFGSTGFSFSSPLSVTSTAKPTTGTSLFGSGSASSTPAFGSGFSGFGTQTSSSGSSTGFTFGGFGGAQSADATTTASSPFGGSLFGGASGQTTGFGTTAHSFGASNTQTATSPSFTTYRK
ncbi:unnamed protein product [Rotaria sp. Silwood1]|nr:unnamed protein product [Rotaria sp. Silwood1]CAF4751691.1 unnamed protein product [Rotaria sp. Silwood1]